MATKALKYEIKAVGWEFAALIAAYVIIFLAASQFLFMIFRAAELISSSNSTINTVMYIESHAYIVLIEVILWTVMARAAIRFKAYTHEIQRSTDGEALNLIADAMLLSFAYAILFDMASTFKTLFMHSLYLPIVTTITNLLPLAIFLILSILLYVGTLRLKRLLPRDPVCARRENHLVILCVGLFSIVIIPFAQYFYRMAPTLLDDDGLHHFALTPGILVAVYILPFVIVWLLGLLSCINLAQYANRVPGKIYKPIFRNLYLGILTAYSSTYLIQIWYVSNVSSNRFGFGLLFLLGLIVMLIAGYALMYRGANKLYMLER